MRPPGLTNDYRAAKTRGSTLTALTESASNDSWKEGFESSDSCREGLDRSLQTKFARRLAQEHRLPRLDLDHDQPGAGGARASGNSRQSAAGPDVNQALRAIRVRRTPRSGSIGQRSRPLGGRLIEVEAGEVNLSCSTWPGAENRSTTSRQAPWEPSRPDFLARRVSRSLNSLSVIATRPSSRPAWRDRCSRRPRPRESRRECVRPGRASPGRIWPSRWTTSADSPGTRPNANPLGMRRTLGSLQALSARGFLLQVALVIDGGFEADHIPGRSRHPVADQPRRGLPVELQGGRSAWSAGIRSPGARLDGQRPGERGSTRSVSAAHQSAPSERSSTRPRSSSVRCQPQVGVVDAEQEAMLGARCEHTIRLETPASHQVVHENADVRLRRGAARTVDARRAARPALIPAIRPCAAASS